MGSPAFNLLHRAIRRALWDLQWKELRPLQVRSIEAFFGCSDPLVLAAATASGKTEAAFLPVLSAMADEPLGGVRAMYVGPLKALINDQFGRLEELCVHSSIPVHRWHGDVPASAKERLRSQPGGVLLITPESLESAFINYGNRLPAIFGCLEHVVIDELHSFIGDVRGVHLRSLLLRLTHLTGRSPRLLGLSATLADFAEARRFLTGDAAGPAVIIEDRDTARAIRIGIKAFPRPLFDDVPDTFRPAASAAEMAEDISILASGGQPQREAGPADPGHLPALENLARDLAGAFGSHANLIFTNSRGLAELVGDALNEIASAERWPRNPFLLHHGSLAKEAREDAERRLKSGEPLSVLCTSTLEMGIDIGSVHSVGQLDPPWSVASLVQRMGRSGRKEGEASILRLYALDLPPGARSETDDLLCPHLLRSIALVELMLECWLEPRDADFPDLSTLVHQILSVLRQTGGCLARHLYATLGSGGAFGEVPEPHFAMVFRELAAHDLIEQTPTGELILAPKGEFLTHAKEFYAAFAGSREFLVRHGQQDVGKLPEHSVPPEGEHLILGARRWRVLEIDSQAMVVGVEPARGRKHTVFMGSAGDVHDRVMAKMAEVLRGDVFYRYLHEGAAGLLGAVRHLARSLRIFELPWIEGPAGCVVFPWVGTRAMRTLAACATADGIEAITGSLSVTYRCEPLVLEAHLAKVADKSFDVLKLAEGFPVQQKCRDKFDHLLPVPLLDLANSRRLLAPAEAAETARAVLLRREKAGG